MKNQQNKHWWYYLPNGTTSLALEMLIPFFIIDSPNAFHYFSSIRLGYFNLFLPVVPN